MPMSLFVLLFVSLCAYAQVDDIANVLSPSKLTPDIKIVCQTDAMLGTIELVIDVQNGKATQVFAGRKYVYQIDSFAYEKLREKKDLRLDLKGKLVAIYDAVLPTERQLSDEIISSSFAFSSSLPTKDGKDFRANQFELASNVKWGMGAGFNISNKTTNSTKCTLVRGGKLVKDLASNSSIRVAGDYNKPHVDNSDRNERKDREDGQNISPPENRASSIGQ